ncbi:unnamed protein product [Cuscuta campestris]|uniref:Replication protein A 70 kDa DNA-binding subunit B/D first OB fold domain-containing protein n=1 Tax=Cuscuta campestris TaxID=132261 RepID=A0A484MKZ9_9ASTE|nr:unnamed protein product [Cuscuta campestris]
MTMFTPIAEINRDKNSWILMLRAIRVYFVPKWAKGGDSMEIVFHDEHGTRIHAHLAREEKEKFETQIIEGTVTVSTAFHVTKMLFDGNFDEVTEFRARLPPQVDEGSIVLSGGAYGEEVLE